MIRTEIETPRLKLRHFNHDDLPVMHVLNTDPDVIRYADDPARDIDETRERLEKGQLTDYKTYGYGRFAVDLKSTGECIGFCGIKYLPEIKLPGEYRFDPGRRKSGHAKGALDKNLWHRSPAL